MRRLLLIVPILALSALVGCAGVPSPGFHCGVDMPSSVSSSALVSPQHTLYGAQGLSTCPTAGQVGVFSAEAVEAAPMPQRQASKQFAPYRAPVVSDCTQDDICRMLREIQRSLEQLPRAQRMPKED